MEESSTNQNIKKYKNNTNLNSIIPLSESNHHNISHNKNNHHNNTSNTNNTNHNYNNSYTSRPNSQSRIKRAEQPPIITKRIHNLQKNRI